MGCFWAFLYLPHLGLWRHSTILEKIYHFTVLEEHFLPAYLPPNIEQATCFLPCHHLEGWKLMPAFFPPATILHTPAPFIVNYWWRQCGSGRASMPDTCPPYKVPCLPAACHFLPLGNTEQAFPMPPYAPLPASYSSSCFPFLPPYTVWVLHHRCTAPFYYCYCSAAAFPSAWVTMPAQVVVVVVGQWGWREW